MKLTLKRTFNNGRYTIGHLYADGVYVCDTIEDVDRDLADTMPLSKIQSVKVKSQTAIPRGTYTVTMNTISPKFSQKPYYWNFCKGRMPRLLNVKGFDGILIHRGTTERDSAGCIIVGYNKVKGQVINSTEAFEKLYKMLDKANRMGNKITLEIQKLWH